MVQDDEVVPFALYDAADSCDGDSSVCKNQVQRVLASEASDMPSSISCDTFKLAIVPAVRDYNPNEFWRLGLKL